MLDWSDIDIAVRDAVREFVDKEIRPHVDALESGEMEPYPIIRKLFATFGIAEMARDSLNKRLAGLREGGGTATAKPSSGGMFGGDGGSAGMGFVVVSELCRVSMGVVTGMGVSLGPDGADDHGTRDPGPEGALASRTGHLREGRRVGDHRARLGFGRVRRHEVLRARDGDDYILNGQKTFITNGPDADVIVVYAKLDEGDRASTGGTGRCSTFVLDAGMEGFVQCKPFKKMGITRLPPESCSSTTCGWARTGCSARPRTASRRRRPGQRQVELLGRTDRRRGAGARHHQGVPAAVRRLRQDPQAVGQGDRPVPADPAQARRDGSGPNQRAEHGVPCHRGAPQAGTSIALAEASAMKWYCSQAATEVAMEAVQLFGGNGYMAEYRVEQLARDAKSLMIYAGSNEVQITHVARGLLSD